MDFLLKEGFRESFINQLINQYDESIIEEFILEEENVKDIIHYFQKIGIKRIDNLLLTRITIFTKDINEVKDAFLRHNIKEIVDEINEDIDTIDLV